ncbi:DUF4241 domain-containing protein [Amycolatopsis sp. cg5]|uniref:DUF4241 domain-containing protein n=1 Tax=Amycolatopsis sp. cg5 TaxID=3238802 RepID=UPI003523F67B
MWSRSRRAWADGVGFGPSGVPKATPSGAFHSGWGDGSYGTWVGRTADGAVAQFVTDFQVINPDQS